MGVSTVPSGVTLAIPEANTDLYVWVRHADSDYLLPYGASTFASSAPCGGRKCYIHRYSQDHAWVYRLAADSAGFTPARHDASMRE